VSARPPSPGKIPNGNVYYCGSCHESGHTFSDGSPPVPSSPVHGNAMQFPFLNTTPTKTWTTDLANQDSDGDGFTNGEELQDPAGTWAIGQADPGDVGFVSNPSDNNPATETSQSLVLDANISQLLAKGGFRWHTRTGNAGVGRVHAQHWPSQCC
jgi:hypothetical protein